MKLRQLELFVAVAEERHFTRASEKLGIAQPPLSQQIKKLEQEFDAKLFHRGTRSVTLSDAGKVLLPYAKIAIKAAHDASIAVRRAARGKQGNVRIGFTPAASFNPIVPGVINSFRESHPNVEITLVEQATTYLFSGLQSQDVDIAFLRPTESQRSELRTIAVSDEKLWAALPIRHPLSSRKRIRLSDLSEDAFILFPRRNGNHLYDSIISACRSAGFSPKIIQEAPQMSSTVNLVAAGIGAAIVPESMCQLHSKGVVYVALADNTPPSRLWAAYLDSRDTSAVVQRFVRHLKHFVKNHK